MGLPRKTHVQHEKLVVDTLTFARKDLGQLGMRFDVEDEYALIVQAGKTQKGMAFPNLHFTLFDPLYRLEDGSIRPNHLAMGIDNDTMPSYRVFEKTRRVHDQTDWIPVLLVKSISRKRELQKAFASQTDLLITTKTGSILQRLIRMRHKIIFATFDDFFSNGFFGVEWKDMDDNRRRIINPNYI